MNNGSLEQYINTVGGALSENDAIPIFYSIAKWIESLHKNKIIHRDINPSHIYLSNQ